MAAASIDPSRHKIRVMGLLRFPFGLASIEASRVAAHYLRLRRQNSIVGCGLWRPVPEVDCTIEATGSQGTAIGCEGKCLDPGVEQPQW